MLSNNKYLYIINIILFIKFKLCNTFLNNFEIFIHYLTNTKYEIQWFNGQTVKLYFIKGY